MRLAELDYPRPEALIAQAPAPERAAARLLVLDRGGAPLRHAHVGDLPGSLRAGDVLVVNDTRVIPARVSGRRPSGGRLELLFVAPLGEEGEWEVLVRGTARTAGRGARRRPPGLPGRRGLAGRQRHARPPGSGVRAAAERRAPRAPLRRTTRGGRRVGGARARHGAPRPAARWARLPGRAVPR